MQACLWLILFFNFYKLANHAFSDFVVVWCVCFFFIQDQKDISEKM